MADPHHLSPPARRAGSAGEEPHAAARRRLARAAAELARRSGPGALTVAAVAQASESTPAEVAEAFGDLKACLRFAALEGHRLSTAPLREVAPGDWRERLAAAIGAYYRAIAAEPALAALHLLDSGAALGLRPGDPGLAESVSAFAPFLAAAAAESGQAPLPAGVGDFLGWVIVSHAVRELRAGRAQSLPGEAAEVGAFVALFYTSDEQRWGRREPTPGHGR